MLLLYNGYAPAGTGSFDCMFYKCVVKEAVNIVFCLFWYVLVVPEIMVVNIFVFVVILFYNFIFFLDYILASYFIFDGQVLWSVCGL